MYSLLAKQYSELFPPDKKRCSFILDEIHASSTPSPRILDAGCATGDLAFELAAKGCRVTGIDLDADMIKIARERTSETEGVRPSPEFYTEDIGNIKQFGSFFSIVCFGNTLPHLTSLNDVKHFFHDAYDTLSSDGRLIFQIINFDQLYGRDYFNFPDIETKDTIFKRSYSVRSDGRIDFNISLTDKKTGRVTPDSLALLPLNRNSVFDMLLQAGFTDIRIYRGYDRIPADGNEFASIYSAASTRDN